VLPSKYFCNFNFAYSATYDRLKHSWFGNYSYSDSHGKVDVKEIAYSYGKYHGQVKRNTETRYGRGVQVFTNNDESKSKILDSFWLDDKRHGPSLAVFPSGNYAIFEHNNGVELSRKDYSANENPAK